MRSEGGGAELRRGERRVSQHQVRNNETNETNESGDNGQWCIMTTRH